MKSKILRALIFSALCVVPVCAQRADAQECNPEFGCEGEEYLATDIPPQEPIYYPEGYISPEQLILLIESLGKYASPPERMDHAVDGNNEPVPFQGSDDPFQDTDGDGISDLDEECSGTDPFNPFNH